MNNTKESPLAVKIGTLAFSSDFSRQGRGFDRLSFSLWSLPWELDIPWRWLCWWRNNPYIRQQLLQVFILENIKNLLTVHNVLTDHLSFEVLYRSSLTEASFSRLVYTMFTLTLRLLSIVAPWARHHSPGWCTQCSHWPWGCWVALWADCRSPGSWWPLCSTWSPLARIG